jgi:hypothetical protein
MVGRATPPVVIPQAAGVAVVTGSAAQPHELAQGMARDPIDQVSPRMRSHVGRATGWTEGEPRERELEARPNGRIQDPNALSAIAAAICGGVEYPLSRRPMEAHHRCATSRSAAVGMIRTPGWRSGGLATLGRWLTSGGHSADYISRTQRNRNCGGYGCLNL